MFVGCAVIVCLCDGCLFVVCLLLCVPCVCDVVVVVVYRSCLFGG